MRPTKKRKIEPDLFKCPYCKKNYFSYHERMCCSECTKETKEAEKEADTSKRGLSE